MSKTYSLNEVLEQVYEFEGVKIVIRPEAREALRYARFTQSYSEWAMHPMHDDSTVSELQLKVDTYLKTTSLDNADDPILSISEMRDIDLQFRAGNSIEIQRSWVSRESWEALKDALRGRIVIR